MTAPSQMELEMRKFVAPEFIFGVGALDLAGTYARNFGASKILVVSDEGVQAAGWTRKATASLERENLAVAVFTDVRANPRDRDVMNGADLYARAGCDLIVAVGGGSPMDCAKGIGIVCANNDHILSFEGVDRVPVPMPPMICIPTTAGTSADVSQFAIISDTERRVKIAIVSKAVVPDVALIDPVTTTTMDAELTACTGMDALCHAVEAYVSNASSPITDLHALEAVRLVSQYLVAAQQDRQNIPVRAAMMMASLHAGLAFSNASLGAVHAMAHSLGGLLDTAHGESNALLLRHVIDFNAPVASRRYDRLAETMAPVPAGIGGRSRQSLGDMVDALRREAGIGWTLGQMGVRRQDIPALSAKAMQDACMVTNPRRPEQSDIEAIYEKAL
jgi:alcohol dehydrogenase